MKTKINNDLWKNVASRTRHTKNPIKISSAVLDHLREIGTSVWNQFYGKKQDLKEGMGGEFKRKILEGKIEIPLPEYLISLRGGKRGIEDVVLINSVSVHNPLVTTCLHYGEYNSEEPLPESFIGYPYFGEGDFNLRNYLSPLYELDKPGKLKKHMIHDVKNDSFSFFKETPERGIIHFSVNEFKGGVTKYSPKVDIVEKKNLNNTYYETWVTFSKI